VIESPFPAPAPRPRAIPVPGVRPVWTYGILAVTCLVYLGQWTLGDSFTYYGLKINDLIRAGESWRFLTPIFFHAGLLHLFFNMYALYNIGRQIERPLGHGLFLVVYFYSGAAGVAASFLFTSANSLGASGAIFGLIGALAVFLYRHTKLFGSIGRSMLYNIFFIIVINLSISTLPGIDIWGHIGGLVAGVLIAWVLGPVWTIAVDPYTGIPSAVNNNPLPRRLPVILLCLLPLIVAALWLIAR
jgi:membrane associated rhomboid family serine protease